MPRPRPRPRARPMARARPRPRTRPMPRARPMPRLRRGSRGPSLDQLLVVALDLLVVAVGALRALLLHRLEQLLAEPLGRAVLVGARDPDRLVADGALLGLARGGAGALAGPGERLGGGARGLARPRRIARLDPLVGLLHLLDRRSEERGVGEGCQF